MFSPMLVEAMVDAGILGENDKVELLDGVLVEMSPQGARHAAAIRRLTNRLVPFATAAGLEVSPQCPLNVVSPISLPEPDSRPSRYRHAVERRVEAEIAFGAALPDRARVPQRAWDTGTPLDCLGRHLDGMVVSTICTLYAKTAAPRTCITPRAQLARLLRSLFAVISVTAWAPLAQTESAWVATTCSVGPRSRPRDG